MAMRALFADSKAGSKARDIILRGVWPLALGEMTTKAAQAGAARLISMCSMKVGANRLQHDTDYLSTIIPDEWKRFWSGKGRLTSPGASGVGPDLWKEAPEWANEWGRRLYSARPASD